MAGAGTRLSIDIWHTSVAAAVSTANGNVVTLTFDGSPQMPFGVAVTQDGVVRTGQAGRGIGVARPDLYVRLPGQRLFDEQITVGAVSVEPVDLVAAVLSRVAEQARTVTRGAAPDELVVCSPDRWVTRQFSGVQVAAGRAGLPKPERVNTGEAIVRDQMALGVAVPVDALVVVCRLEETLGELVLLQRVADEFEQRAAWPLGELGQTPGATVAEQAGTALAQALADNASTGEQVSAVFCQIPEASFAALCAAFAGAASLVVEPVRVDDVAAARGGLQAAVSTSGGTPSWRWAKLIHSVVGVAVSWCGAAALAYQLFTTGNVYAATSTSPTRFVTQWFGWGLAAVLVLLGLVGATLAVSDVRSLRADSLASTAGPDRRLGAAVMFAAAFGVAVAAMLGLIGAAQFHVDAMPILAWTLGATVPLAVLVAVLGLLAGRVPTAGGWPDGLRFPVEAATLAAVSAVSVVGGYAGFPGHDDTTWWWMEHVGAVGMGLAVAWLVAPPPWSLSPEDLPKWGRLFVVGALFGGPATFAIGLNTVDVIGAFLIGAVTAWWLVRLVTVAGPALSALVQRQELAPPTVP